MDQKIPFTSYDFWAYLSAGFMLLFALDPKERAQVFTVEQKITPAAGWSIISLVKAGYASDSA